MQSGEMDQMLEFFLEENQDRFQELDHDLIRLEDNPCDEGLLYSILRNIHSLKGAAAMFGFSAMKTVAHKLEDLTAIAHAQPDAVNREIMNMLFEGRDILQSMFEMVSSNKHENELSSREKSFLSRLEALVDAKSSNALSLEKCAGELIALVREILPALEASPKIASLTKALNDVSCCLVKSAKDNNSASIKGQLYLGGEDVGGLLCSIKENLARAEQSQMSRDDAEPLYSFMEALLDAMKREDARICEEAVAAEELLDLSKDMDMDVDGEQIRCFKKLVEEVETRAGKRERAAAEASSKENDQGELKSKQTNSPRMEIKTVRVNESKIDAFLDSVGEMIILNEVFNHLQDRIERTIKEDLKLVKEFKFANSSFANQLYSLQRSLMDLRRVELKNITGNLARLVRDAAGQTEKNIEFIARGGDAVVDKSLLQEVDTCLVHLVRNAVDHGIEPERERRRLGKPSPAQVTVETSNEENFLLIKIKDDGRGVNFAMLREQAAASGIISHDRAEEMSDEESCSLIFKNGLSTAKNVTDRSGRGVGMSAVFENLQKIGGSINIRSEPNKGTEISLRIPLSATLSVMEGFIVKVGSAGLVVPISCVVETFELADHQVSTVHEKGECVLLRGEIYPLIRLGDHFNIKTSTEGRKASILTRTDKGNYCLLVDKIVDCHQIVVKEIAGLNASREILGGALLGDGTIGLVLNVDQLISARKNWQTR